MAIVWSTTDDGRLLVAAFLAGEPVQGALTHLAVGTGAQAIPPDPAQHGLVHEIGRVLYLERFFVTETPGGPLAVDGITYAPSATPTNLIYFRFRFEDLAAQGNWSEFALVGRDVTYVSRGAELADGPQAGDDRAGRDVILGGSYTAPAAQTITVTVSVAGGAGVAQINWVSNGLELPGGAIVTFGVPVPIGGTGLALTFTGGPDGSLTVGDSWELRATIDTASPSFAGGGVYDPATNPDGQVRTPGQVFAIAAITPPAVKGASTEDVQLVVEVLR